MRFMRSVKKETICSFKKVCRQSEKLTANFFSFNNSQTILKQFVNIAAVLYRHTKREHFKKIRGEIIMNEYTANTTAERAKAQNIQKQYIAREENKLDQLKRLDSKVKAPGKNLRKILSILATI